MSLPLGLDAVDSADSECASCSSPSCIASTSNDGLSPVSGYPVPPGTFECQVPDFGEMSELTDVAARLEAKAVALTVYAASVTVSAERARVAAIHARKGCDPGMLPQELSFHETINTTIMLRNIPSRYTRDQVRDMLDSEGFAGQYNFLYLPVDFRRLSGLGYAFVNFRLPEQAQRAFWHFQGWSSWGLQSSKVCNVSWSVPCQGVEQHIQRFRNSPVMHESVPEKYKPCLFDDNGEKLVFPDPTKKVRRPRVRFGAGTRCLRACPTKE